MIQLRFPDGYRFPGRYTFSLMRNGKTGEQSILITKCRATCKLENIKFSHVRSFLLEPATRLTPLEVKEVQTQEELIKTVKELTDFWGVKASVKS